nr:MAG TPA: hypothetical protein [Crassvirales sp.]
MLNSFLALFVNLFIDLANTSSSFVLGLFRAFTVKACIIS